MNTQTVDTFVRDRLPAPDEQPEYLFELPELQYPERLNAAVSLLSSAPPETVAVLSELGSWTYGELDELSDRIASLLQGACSLIPGNRVLLAGPNGMKLLAAWLGILKAGGIAVAIVPILRAGEIGKILAKSQASHAIVHSDCEEVVHQAATECGIALQTLRFGGDAEACELLDKAQSARVVGPYHSGRDEPALVAFTSGTTGVPKGCVQFHRDILASGDSFARHVLRPSRGMKWSCTAPLAFTFGLGMQFVFPLRFGGTAVIPSAPGPQGLLEAIERHKVDICATAPTAYRAMLAKLDEIAIDSLKTCVSAGEHLPEATWRAWKEATGLAIVDGIGATEMMHIFISASGEEIRPGATGRAVPGYRATVLDEDGAFLSAGMGRLAVKGPTGCRYLDDARQGKYVVDGWNVTGDTFRLDQDGYFWFVARSDDMIVSAGYNISGPEVEEALYSHPLVAECAVVGVPCEKRGCKVKAFVVLRDGGRPDAETKRLLQEHVKQQIAPYKYPREIAFLGALPKTPTGKLKRFALRSEG